MASRDAHSRNVNPLHDAVATDNERLVWKLLALRSVPPVTKDGYLQKKSTQLKMWNTRFFSLAPPPPPGGGGPLLIRWQSSTDGNEDGDANSATMAGKGDGNRDAQEGLKSKAKPTRTSTPLGTTQLPLRPTCVRRVPGHPTRFEVTGLSENLHLQASSDTEAQLWVQAIESAVIQAMAARDGGGADSQDSLGRLPLHVAVASAHWDIANALIEAYPQAVENPDPASDSFSLPLHTAIRQHAPEDTIIRLWRAFPQAAAVHSSGSMALHGICEQRMWSLFGRILRAHPAAMEVHDAEGWSPFERLWQAAAREVTVRGNRLGAGVTAQKTYTNSHSDGKNTGNDSPDSSRLSGAASEIWDMVVDAVSVAGEAAALAITRGRISVLDCPASIAKRIVESSNFPSPLHWMPAHARLAAVAAVGGHHADRSWGLLEPLLFETGATAGHVTCGDDGASSGHNGQTSRGKSGKDDLTKVSGGSEGLPRVSTLVATVMEGEAVAAGVPEDVCAAFWTVLTAARVQHGLNSWVGEEVLSDVADCSAIGHERVGSGAKGDTQGLSGLRGAATAMPKDEQLMMTRRLQKDLNAHSAGRWRLTRAMVQRASVDTKSVVHLECRVIDVVTNDSAMGLEEEGGQRRHRHRDESLNPEADSKVKSPGHIRVQKRRLTAFSCEDSARATEVAEAVRACWVRLCGRRSPHLLAPVEVYCQDGFVWVLREPLLARPLWDSLLGSSCSGERMNNSGDDAPGGEGCWKAVRLGIHMLHALDRLRATDGLDGDAGLDIGKEVALTDCSLFFDGPSDDPVFVVDPCTLRLIERFVAAGPTETKENDQKDAAAAIDAGDQHCRDRDFDDSRTAAAAVFRLATGKSYDQTAVTDVYKAVLDAGLESTSNFLLAHELTCALRSTDGLLTDAGNTAPVEKLRIGLEEAGVSCGEGPGHFHVYLGLGGTEATIKAAVALKKRLNALRVGPRREPMRVFVAGQKRLSSNTFGTIEKAHWEAMSSDAQALARSIVYVPLLTTARQDDTDEGTKHMTKVDNSASTLESKTVPLGPVDSEQRIALGLLTLGKELIEKRGNGVEKQQKIPGSFFMPMLQAIVPVLLDEPQSIVETAAAVPGKTSADGSVAADKQMSKSLERIFCEVLGLGDEELSAIPVAVRNVINSHGDHAPTVVELLRHAETFQSVSDGDRINPMGTTATATRESSTDSSEHADNHDTQREGANDPEDQAPRPMARVVDGVGWEDAAASWAEKVGSVVESITWIQRAREAPRRRSRTSSTFTAEPDEAKMIEPGGDEGAGQGLTVVMAPPGPLGLRLSRQAPLKVLGLVDLPDGRPSPMHGKGVTVGLVLLAVDGRDASGWCLEDFKKVRQVEIARVHELTFGRLDIALALEEGRTGNDEGSNVDGGFMGLRSNTNVSIKARGDGGHGTGGESWLVDHPLRPMRPPTLGEGITAARHLGRTVRGKLKGGMDMLRTPNPNSPIAYMDPENGGVGRSEAVLGSASGIPAPVGVSSLARLLKQEVGGSVLRAQQQLGVAGGALLQSQQSSPMANLAAAGRRQSGEGQVDGSNTEVHA